MKKKQIVLICITLLGLALSLAVYSGVKKSSFTKEDLLSEKSRYISASNTTSKLRRIITDIPAADKIIFLNEESNFENDCHYSRKNTQAGVKSRFCEKKIIAYAGISKNQLQPALAYMKSSLLALPFDRDQGRVVTNRDLENAYFWDGKSGIRLEVRLQTKQKNNLKNDKALTILSTSDYVLDIYYYDVYSEIYKPLSLFDYF